MCVCTIGIPIYFYPMQKWVNSIVNFESFICSLNHNRLSVITNIWFSFMNVCVWCLHVCSNSINMVSVLPMQLEKDFNEAHTLSGIYGRLKTSWIHLIQILFNSSSFFLLRIVERESRSIFSSNIIELWIARELLSADMVRIWRILALKSHPINQN